VQHEGISIPTKLEAMGQSARKFQRAADYVDKILRGTKPADLPVEQPTKLDLVINIKTAKAIGLTIPVAFLLRADEVIDEGGRRPLLALSDMSPLPDDVRCQG
jgi:hypothetical protein